MPLVMEVGLSPGEFVFDGDPATPRKKGTPTRPNFGPCLLWPNGWIDVDATWYGSRHRPWPHCVRRGPSYRRKVHSSPRLFGACLLWPRSPISATAELLLRYASGETDRQTGTQTRLSQRFAPPTGGNVVRNFSVLLPGSFAVFVFELAVVNNGRN